MRHHHHQTPVLSQRVRRAGRDPFLARIGLMILGCALLAPIAMIFRTTDGGGVESAGLPGAAAVLEIGDPTPAPAAVAGGALIPPDQAAALAATQPTAAPPSLVSQSVAPAAVAIAPPAPAAAPAAAPQPSAAAPIAPATTAPPAPPSSVTMSSIAAVPETAPAVAETVAINPNCRDPYSVVAGDYWSGIAKRYQITTQELLDNNNAGATTAIYPGDVICLPRNAVKPSEAPATTAASAPATTKPTPATTKPAPATTKPAPATTAAPPPPPQRSYSEDEIKDIIRSVFPDDLEDKALQIAGRESGYDPRAKNYCCYGLFQLYWDVHKSWMKAAGISSAQELYDPEVNAYAAYLLYQRNGGWGPWSQTNGP